MVRFTTSEPPLLVLAGRVGWMSDAVVARAKASPRVRWLGEVADADLPPLLAGAEVFVSPSSYEGFGLAVAEAMAAGTAVIGGSGSSLDEVVADPAARVDELIHRGCVDGEFTCADVAETTARLGQINRLIEGDAPVWHPEIDGAPFAAGRRRAHPRRGFGSQLPLPQDFF